MQNFHILCICPRLDLTRGLPNQIGGGVRKKVGGVNPPGGGVEKSMPGNIRWYRDGIGNTNEDNSGIFSIIRMY